MRMPFIDDIEVLIEGRPPERILFFSDFALSFFLQDHADTNLGLIDR